jgi:hypothetical protein
MAEYRRGAHTVFEIHLHLVWITKYRRPALQTVWGRRDLALPDEIDDGGMMGGGGPHGVGVAGARVVPRQGRHPFANYRCKRFECRFSAPRSQGNCVSSKAMASAVVGRSAARGGTGTALGGEIRARRARWLRPKARPPRAPRRRSCIGDLLKRARG